MTVHVSKGLEFPVVYVPFGWDRWLARQARPAAAARRRRPAGARRRRPGRARLRRARWRRHAAEESGEELRLLYVALTRAQCQVVAHWAPTTEHADRAAAPRCCSARAGAGGVPPARRAAARRRRRRRAPRPVAGASGGTVSAAPRRAGAPARWQPPAEPAPALGVVPLHPHPGHRLAAHVLQRADPRRRTTTPGGRQRAGGAGHGRRAGRAAARARAGRAGRRRPRSPLDDLPGGTAFGTLVHEVLEDLDPAAPRRALRRRGRPPSRRRRRRRRPWPTGCARSCAPRWGRRAGAGRRRGGRPAARARLRAAARRRRRRRSRTPRSPTSPRCCAGTTCGAARRLRRPAGRRSTPQALRGFLTGSIDAVLRLPGPRLRRRRLQDQPARAPTR